MAERTPFVLNLHTNDDDVQCVRESNSDLFVWKLLPSIIINLISNRFSYRLQAVVIRGFLFMV